jgi:hypothetical protein
MVFDFYFEFNNSNQYSPRLDMRFWTNVFEKKCTNKMSRTPKSQPIYPNQTIFRRIKNDPEFKA